MNIIDGMQYIELQVIISFNVHFLHGRESYVLVGLRVQMFHHISLLQKFSLRSILYFVRVSLEILVENVETVDFLNVVHYLQS